MRNYIKTKGIEAICEKFNYSLAHIKLHLKTTFPNASSSNLYTQLKQFKKYLQNKNNTNENYHIQEILDKLGE
ncbi:hypothetical protein J6A31_03240 [bacterium]|nr:hypothetical protein [bacterium]